MSVGISGIPDYNSFTYPVTWYIDVTPYIYSPLVPIPQLILSTNWTGPENVIVFNQNKTIKIELDDQITFDLGISVSYFGVIASDIIRVDVND